MDVTRVATKTKVAAAPKKTTTAASSAVANPADGFVKSSPSDVALAKPTHAPRPTKPNPNDSEATSGEPVLGKSAAPPSYSAGPLSSPVFKGTEAEYFKEARSILEGAKPGDIVGIQMYEFQNAQTNLGDAGAVNAPGYADQQALLGAIKDAAARGVNMHLILDASKDEKTGKLNNQPIIDDLTKAAGKTGNITLDLYPPNVVNIDHAKEIFHLAKAPGGHYTIDRVLAGGSNWGNHTPANDDGGAVFYGRDAKGAVDIFYRDQAFCRGDSTSAPLPAQDPNAAVQWHVTAPDAEGGGSKSIKDAKMALLQNAADTGGGAYLNEFCLNDKDILDLGAKMGPNFHTRVDPSESHVNKPGLDQINAAGGQALYANTMMDPVHMPGQKNHEKLDVITNAQGNAIALTLGSANDTNQGLEGTRKETAADGTTRTAKPNHEIDAEVHLVTTNERTADGSFYSTAGLLNDALAKTKNDLAHNSSTHVPNGVYGTNPGGGAAPTF